MSAEVSDEERSSARRRLMLKRAMRLVAAECDRQEALYPGDWARAADGTRNGGMNVVALTHARLTLDRHKREGTVTRLDILEEEFCEVAVSEDRAALRAELVQVAACCVSWIAALDAETA